MTQNKYFIKSLHTIHKDDYNEGEGEYIHEYNLNAFITAETPKDAIIKYFDKELYLSFDIDKSFYEEDGILHYSNLVDQDNTEPSEYKINLWKEGKKTLYVNNTEIHIFEVNRITEL